MFVSLKLAKGMIPFNTTFSFKINLRNSISSRPSGPIILERIIQGRDGFLVANAPEGFEFPAISEQVPAQAKGSLAIGNIE